MPRRDDLHRILLIGSGPIVIGQACEFDYSGTQACKALKNEGYTVILVNSNPATIMTDPEVADRTYVEPITAEIVEKVIVAEKPDAILPTLGGQTALNIAMEMAESGTLARHHVELIGATAEVIRRAEDRRLFKDTMIAIGLDVPRSREVTTAEDALAAARELGYPLVLRPAFTLGGTGGGIAYNASELRDKIRLALDWSPIHQVLLEESVLGWKEFELEVMRDKKDNCVVVCSIENFDPMGVHTGDSITVAPAQTLTDPEYQRMRDAAFAVMRAIGVETGGSNIQFAVNPANGRMVLIEMNPRVSRSSALASKATGFPIAKIAARLAVGYTLDELPNDITKTTPASFEPSIDYVVTKIPRFAFEKFPDTPTTLDTQMRSVGEVMAIGRTFKESLQKALRSLENGLTGLDGAPTAPVDAQELTAKLANPSPDRILAVRDALAAGMKVDEIERITRIDPWFLRQIGEITATEAELREAAKRKTGRVPAGLSPADLLRAKRTGFSDAAIAKWSGTTEEKIASARRTAGIKPSFKMVDTCAAEFESKTPYLYSTYEPFDEAPPTAREKYAILGSGPNRIGQGVEFDYCCVHAAYALKEEGYEVIMINCNPETVSTDYDTSDRLYFEPLTHEDVLAVLKKEKVRGVILQLGGQTPLKLARGLEKAGVRIIGTSFDSIDMAEDRKRFDRLLTELKIDRPQAGTARSLAEALVVADRIGYPVLVRPSYVLGGRAMEIVYDGSQMEAVMTRAIAVSPEHPVLVDKFLEDAIEVDVDCVADGERVVIAGVMEHIEEAGIHSGDSAMVLPPHTLTWDLVDKIERHTKALALALKVKGLMNVQFAVRNDNVYVLEVNPRASRTVPFVSKVTGIPWAKIATKVMTGRSLDDLGVRKSPEMAHVGIKESVFPFDRFPGTDIILGPEMKSTGEVMGIDATFGAAFAKSQLAAGTRLPAEGTVFVSVRNREKRGMVSVVRGLADMGFRIIATEGTARALDQSGITVTRVPKVHEGVRPNVLDLIKNGEVQLIINVPSGKGPRSDNYAIRRAAVVHRIPCVTTLAGAQAMVSALDSVKSKALGVKPLQDYHAEMRRPATAPPA
jgi:carbamoyl-phosphate synthase large subunit